MKKETTPTFISECPAASSLCHKDERALFLAAISDGLDAIRAGRVVSHQDVKNMMRQWLGTKNENQID